MKITVSFPSESVQPTFDEEKLTHRRNGEDGMNKNGI